MRSVICVKILSYNIQAAIGSKKASDYITKSHRQFFNVRAKQKTLKNIGKFIAAFDVVCLQEVDLGGRRSGYESQLGALQKHSGLQYVEAQINRQVGRTSIHGNAILSRFKMTEIGDHKLPSRVPGRGKLICKIGDTHFVNTHLSLDRKTQEQQLSFIKDTISGFKKVIITGDLNCQSHAPHLESFAQDLGLSIMTTPQHKTYPSWAPRQGLDHIIASQGFSLGKVKSHKVMFSDHLPVSIDISD